jgi:hypothetical protein
MTIDREEADATLNEIEAITRRVKQSSIYRASSLVIIFWGVVIVAGNVAALFAGRWTGYVWLALDLAGVAGTVAILARAPKSLGQGVRILLAFVLFFIFGFAWSTLLGKFGPRELDAFWPTLFMFGYALAGLWFGRAFTLLGVGLAALILIGYFWSGDAFDLYLAAVNGGGLILCGLWMRRA